MFTPSWWFVCLCCCRSFPSLWLFVGQLVGSCGLVVHLPGVSAGELPPAPVPLRLTQLSFTTSLHCGLHGSFKSVDRRVYMHPGSRGRSYARRIWPTWCPLGGGPWLSGNRMGLGVCIWSECAAADSRSCAVWSERDMCPGLWEVAFPWKCTHMCTFLPHSFPYPCLSSTGRSWGVQVLTLLPSLTPATTVLSAAILFRLPFSANYDEHPVLAYSHRFIHPPLLGVT